MISRIINESIQKFILNEISKVDTKSNVTVCSLKEFSQILQENGITRDNCEDFIGKFAFIEIGSSKNRIEQEYYRNKYMFNPNKFNNHEDFFENGQFLLPEAKNVIHLTFDDIKSDDVDDEGYFTKGRVGSNDLVDGMDAKYKYKEPRMFGKNDAIKVNNFINEQLSINDNVYFIVHCLMGQSRSAAIGSYIVKKVNKVKFSDFLDDYAQEGENENGIRNHQFEHGINMKQYGKPSYPNSVVFDKLSKVGKMDKDWYKKEYNRYFNIGYYKRKAKRLKENGDLSKLSKFIDSVRKYYDSDNDFIKDFGEFI